MLIFFAAFALHSLSQLELQHLEVGVLRLALVELREGRVNSSGQVSVKLDGYVLRRRDLKDLRLVTLELRLGSHLPGDVALRAPSKRVVM